MIRKAKRKSEEDKFISFTTEAQIDKEKFKQLTSKLIITALESEELRISEEMDKYGRPLGCNDENCDIIHLVDLENMIRFLEHI